MAMRIPRDEFEQALFRAHIESRLSVLWPGVDIGFANDPQLTLGEWIVYASKPAQTVEWSTLLDRPQVAATVWLEERDTDSEHYRVAVAWSLPAHEGHDQAQHNIDARPFFGWERDA